MEAANVAVAGLQVSLVRRCVFEQLDIRTVAATDQGDLLDHRLGVDAQKILHERALVVGERAEGHCLLAADNLGEEVDGLLHVGHRNPGVIVSAHARNGIG